MKLGATTTASSGTPASAGARNQIATASMSTAMAATTAQIRNWMPVVGIAGSDWLAMDSFAAAKSWANRSSVAPVGITARIAVSAAKRP